MFNIIPYPGQQFNSLTSVTAVKRVIKDKDIFPVGNYMMGVQLSYTPKKTLDLELTPSARVNFKEVKT